MSLPKLSKGQLRKEFESFLNEDGVEAFRTFEQELIRKYDGRIAFSFQQTELAVCAKPQKPRPKGSRQWVWLIKFSFRGKRKYSRIGSCFVMETTEIDLRKYGYSPSVARDFYSRLREVDPRLQVGRPVAEQIPLNEVNAEILSGLSEAIAGLIEALCDNEDVEEPTDSAATRSTSERKTRGVDLAADISAFINDYSNRHSDESAQMLRRFFAELLDRSFGLKRTDLKRGSLKDNDSKQLTVVFEFDHVTHHCTKFYPQGGTRLQFKGMHSPFGDDTEGLRRRKELHESLKTIAGIRLVKGTKPHSTELSEGFSEEMDYQLGDPQMYPSPILNLENAQPFFEFLDWWREQIVRRDSRVRVADGQNETLLANASETLESEGRFDLVSLEDERSHTLRAIADRRGQTKFREKLLSAYHGNCAITACDAVAALEAAHIHPFCGRKSDHVTNGLLLRADIHTLFDLDLVGIHPESKRVELARPLRGTEYMNYEHKHLRLPSRDEFHPDKAALEWKWAQFQSN